jgi:hypothetical protein
MEYPGGRRAPKVPYDGSQRETVDMGVNNFLIEIVFKTEAGQKSGVLVSKAGDAGYSRILFQIWAGRGVFTFK